MNAIRDIILYLALILVIIHNTVPHEDHTSSVFKSEVGNDISTKTLYSFLFHAFQEGLPDLVFQNSLDHYSIQDKFDHFQTSEAGYLISIENSSGFSDWVNTCFFKTPTLQQLNKSSIPSLRAPPTHDII